MNRFFKPLLALAAALAVAGCAGTGTTDSAAINSLVQNANGNTVIIARDTGFAGSAPRIFISMDGTQVASLGNNEVQSFQAGPGQHTLDPKFEGLSIGLETKSLTFTNNPSTTQYFVVRVTQKFASAKMFISEVSANSFREAIN